MCISDRLSGGLWWWRQASQRPLPGLFALFLATLAIREHDYLFEKTALHWSIPAFITGISAVIWAIIKRHQFAEALHTWSRHPASSMLLVSLVTLLVFSRLFGKEALWQAMLGDDYHRSMKNMVEESTELFGYALILASVCLHGLIRRTNRALPNYGESSTAAPSS